MAVIHHTIVTGQSLATYNQGTSLSGTQTRPTEITYFSGGTRLALEKLLLPELGHLIREVSR